jgi:hypothetical protein
MKQCWLVQWYWSMLFNEHAFTMAIKGSECSHICIRGQKLFPSHITFLLSLHPVHFVVICCIVLLSIFVSHLSFLHYSNLHLILFLFSSFLVFVSKHFCVWNIFIYSHNLSESPSLILISIVSRVKSDVFLYAKCGVDNFGPLFLNQCEESQ